MALTYDKTQRDLSIKGVLTLNTSDQVYLTDEDIVSYSINASVGAEGIPLGTVESASYTLTLKNVGRRFSPEQLDNAEVHMFVGINNGSGYEYSDFGVWYVNDSNAPEQSVAITLNGLDALATRFEAYFFDSEGSYPSTIGSLAQTACVAAGIEIARTNFPNAAIQISKMPEWKEETTLRDVLSYCAVCAGGFARINRNGQLDIVSYSEGKNYTLGPGMYQTFTQTGGYAFRFNRIEAFMNEDDEERASFAVSSSIEPNATNTLQIDYNPLLTNTIMQSVVNELKDIALVAGELMWGGDPAVQLGDFYTLTDLKGNTHRIMVTNQSFNFGGGLNSVESCVLPALNSQNSATYSTSTNMYDAKGNIRATRISGLDKKVITATTGHFENLTAESAEIDTLLVSLLNAVNLIANMIDAKVIKAGSITAEQLSADAISADLIEAGALEAITAHIEKLTAGDVYTDRLGAALAAFSVITAGTANFDRATIGHLVSNLFNLTGSGVMEDVFIYNLKIAYAQVIAATIGNLVLMSSDGKYYQIDINSEGNITASRVFPTDEEKAEGVFGQTRPIIATTMTVDDMNAGTVKAVQAVINRIYAAQIDTDELWARQAFIDRLMTTDISSNSTIRIMAGQIEDAADKSTTVYEAYLAGDLDGKDGIQGPPGENGATSYFHIKYAPVQNPSASQMTDTPNIYIGTYVDYTEADSDDPGKYTWARFQGLQGENGIPGTNGADGKTSYLHIKYSNDGGESLTTNNGEDVGDWIGQYVDYTQADSTDPKKYTWAKIKGEPGVGIFSVQEHYAKSTSNTTAPTRWQSTPPTLTSTERYLWNYETITYTNSSTSDTKKRVIGVYGDTGATGATGPTGPTGETGNGIANITNYYLATSESSGVTTSTSGWTPTVQNVSADKKYLWNYEVVSYTNGGSETTDPVIIGAYGDAGVSVSSFKAQYYVSTSKETPTGGSWEYTMPEWEFGLYVWHRNEITYSNGDVAHTEPYVDTGWEAAYDAQEAANNAGAMASAAVAAIGEIPNYVDVKSDGLHINDQYGASTMHINSASVSIGTSANSAADGYSQFTASYVQFGNYQLRQSADGGLVFKLKG